MQLEVVIAGPDGKLRSERHLASEALSVGRHRECSIFLADDHISRHHAILVASATAMRVEDNSCNGTLVGDTLLCRSACEVPFDTPILIGTHTLRVRPVRAGLDHGETLAPASAPALDFSGLPPEEPIPAEVDAELRREIHRQLLRHLNLAGTPVESLSAAGFRPRVLAALRSIIRSLDDRLPEGLDRARLTGELAEEALGLGPLEQLLADPTVTEIMVVDAKTIYVERAGKLIRTPLFFTDDDRVRAVIERIVTPLGRRIDESSPLVDARLSDGSRVNAIIRPLALRGSCITIRKFAKIPLTLARLYELDALTPAMGRFLTRCVLAKKNIVISGGTGSGKTTLLNVLAGVIPTEERIVTIEDAAELQLAQPHAVALETRPPNLEGKGSYTVRDLVKNALRMRPDRIVVGECRGGEALDMLQAMNTGHEGSLTTTHANSPREALARLETLSLMSEVDLPARVIRDQIATSVQVVVQTMRLSDGSRKVTDIAEVCGVDHLGEVNLQSIYRFVRRETSEKGQVLGAFAATGQLPSFLGQFMVCGLIQPGEPYL